MYENVVHPVYIHLLLKVAKGSINVWALESQELVMIFSISA